MTKTVEKYFSILDEYFGDALEWANKKKYVKEERMRAVGEIVAPSAMESILDSLHHEMTKLDWNQQEKSVKNLGGLKASYIGSYYIQSYNLDVQSFLKKTALYSDTVLLSDPVFTELIAWKRRGKGDIASFGATAELALSYLDVKDFFIADDDSPICSLLPSPAWSLNPDSEKILNELITDNLVAYSNEVFGKDFGTLYQLDEFLKKIKNFKEFISLAKKPEMITNAMGERYSEDHFKNMKDYWEGKYLESIQTFELFEAALRARFLPIISQFMTDGKFTSSFVTDFKGCWESTKWLMRRDNEEYNKIRSNVFSKDSLVLNAFQEENLKWLGNVPLNDLLKLRQRGELQDLRDIIGKNINEITNASDEEFIEVGNQVKYNLDQAFRKHDAEVNDLSKTYKRRFKIDATSIIVSGGIAIVSALYPPLAQCAGLTTAMVGGGSVLDMINTFRNKLEEEDKLLKKPVTLLFNAKKMSN